MTLYSIAERGALVPVECLLPCSDNILSLGRPITELIIATL